MMASKQADRVVITVASGITATASSPAPTEQHELSELERHEPIELAKSDSLAKRNDKTLFLHLMSGESVKLTNRDSCGTYDDCLIYVYRGLLADKQFFLVSVRFYEGGSTLLISRKTGKQYDVIDEPHISPNGKYIVAANDQEAYGHPGVYLWEINNESLIPRFLFEPSEYQLYQFIRWDGSDKVELLKTVWAPKEACPENTLIEFPVRLIAQNDEWKLEGTFERDKIQCNTH